MEEILKVPQDQTKPDQWEISDTMSYLNAAQSHLCYVRRKSKMAQGDGTAVANDVNEALEMAIKEKGKDAHISIIPDGVSLW